MIIWGNHSATQYPDLHHATVDGKPALSVVGESWFKDAFIPTVQQRGAAVIKARGTSSAASAASAAIDHMHDWVLGTADGRLGQHGHSLRRQLRYSPGRHLFVSGHLQGRPLRIVQGLTINEFSREKMLATHRELWEERDGVKDLI